MSRVSRRLAGLASIVALTGSMVAASAGPVMAGTPPANDDFENAEPITSLPATRSVDTTAATTQPGEYGGHGCPGQTSGHSVWYRLELTTDQDVRLDTLGSSVDLSIAVWQGSGLGDLDQVDCNRSISPSNEQARLTFRLEANEGYWISIGTAYEGVQGGAVVFNARSVTRPADDDVETPTTIQSLPFDAAVSNVDATVSPTDPYADEDDESFCHQGNLRTSRWFRFVADHDAVVAIKTAESQIDTLLAIWRGPAATPQRLACVAYQHSTRGELAVVRVTAGTEYLIQLGGYLGHTGTMQLRLREVLPPPNDDFEDARRIDPASLPATITADTRYAFAEDEEWGSSCADFNELIDHTVWYKLRLPVTSNVRLDTAGSDFDTELSVWEGPALGSLDEVSCNASPTPGWPPTDARLTFRARAGVSYWINAATPTRESPGGQLQLRVRTVAEPSGDDAQAPIEIRDLPYSTTIDLVHATTQPFETATGEYPCVRPYLTNTRWFRYVARRDAVLQAYAFGGSLWPSIGVYTGTPPDVHRQGCAHGTQSPPGTSLVTRVKAGQTYSFQVGAHWNRAGTTPFQLTEVIPPRNDDFGSAATIDLANAPVARTARLGYATRQRAEPREWCLRGQSPSVWYRLVPTTANRIAITGNGWDAGDGFETVVDVYTGSSLATLDGVVTCHYGDPVEFVPIAGVTYYVRVVGQHGAGDAAIVFDTP